MNIILILSAILPVLGWGFMPIIAKINGGNSRETMLGTTVFVLLVTGIFSFFQGYTYDFSTFLVSFLSGFLWGIGQWLQFESFEKINVSEAMPISNGTQLLFTSVLAWVFLNEWPGLLIGIFSIFSLSIMIAGIFLINKKEQSNQQSSLIRAIILLCISSLALAMYVSITKYFKIAGGIVFFPQSIGMVLFTILLLVVKRERIRFKIVARNWTTGLSWLIANIAIFYASQEIGLGLVFSISQLCVLISIFGGILILNEQKTKAEIAQLKIGTVLICVGILLLGLTK